MSYKLKGTALYFITFNQEFLCVLTYQILKTLRSYDKQGSTAKKGLNYVNFGAFHSSRVLFVVLFIS